MMGSIKIGQSSVMIGGGPCEISGRGGGWVAPVPHAAQEDIEQLF